MRLITTKQQASVAVNVLVNSYANAPNINWMFSQTPRKLRYFFGVLVEDAMNKKGAYLTSDDFGVLLYHDSNATNFSFSSALKKLHIVFFIMGLKKSFQVVRLNRLKRKYRKKKCIYASALAIMNHESQLKTTFELKKEFSVLSKKSEQPIYLETTNPRYLLLYEKLGFSMYFQMKHMYTNLNIYFMKMEKW